MSAKTVFELDMESICASGDKEDIKKRGMALIMKEFLIRSPHHQTAVEMFLATLGEPDRPKRKRPNRETPL